MPLVAALPVRTTTHPNAVGPNARTLLTIPAELRQEIVRELPLESLAALKLTCRAFAADVDDPAVWRAQHRSAYGALDKGEGPRAAFAARRAEELGSRARMLTSILTVANTALTCAEHGAAVGVRTLRTRRHARVDVERERAHADGARSTLESHGAEVRTHAVLFGDLRPPR